jgi:ribosomal protein L19
MFFTHFRIKQSFYYSLLICDKNYKRIVRYPYSVLKNKSLSYIDIKGNVIESSLNKSQLSIDKSYSETSSLFSSLSGPIDERHFYLTNLMTENLHPKLRSNPSNTQAQKIPVIRTGDRLLFDCFTALVKQKSKVKMVKKKKDDLKQSQIYSGRVISKKIDKRRIQSSSVTLFREKKGYRSEKSIPLNSPWIKGIGVASRSNVSRSKLYYLRKRSTKKSRFRSRFFSKKRFLKELAKEEPVYFEENATI